MFDDFGQEPATSEGRGRRSLSAVLSLGIFAALALGVGGAIAARQVQQHRQQKEVEVTFEDIPRPKPQQQPKVAKPTVKAPSTQRRKATSRKPVVAPKAIPTETPSEAEGELAEAEGTGPIEGFTDGGDGPPTPTPPPPPPPPPPPRAPHQARESIAKPRFLSGCRAPEVPPTLEKVAATIIIEVRTLVGADGHVLDAKVINPNPLIPDELLLTCARAQVYEPARLPDGTAVPFPVRRRYAFRPA